jgi:hypothetical protein
MGRFTAVIIFLVCFFIVGFFIPFLVSAFQDISRPNTSSSVYPLVKFMTSTGGHVIMPFYFFLPTLMKESYNNVFNCFTYVPAPISLILLFTMVVCLVYIFLTLVPTVGG